MWALGQTISYIEPAMEFAWHILSWAWGDFICEVHWSTKALTKNTPIGGYLKYHVGTGCTLSARSFSRRSLSVLCIWRLTPVHECRAGDVAAADAFV
jgi:hypothetical protein